MSQSTAGKGPGLVLRASNHSGACKLSLSTAKDRALLEIMEAGGRSAAVGLSVPELRLLARSLNQVALALTAASLTDDTTSP